MTEKENIDRHRMEVLEKHGGNRTRAADELKINRRTLQKWLVRISGAANNVRSSNLFADK